MAFTWNDDFLASALTEGHSLDECPGVVEYGVRSRPDASIAWINRRWFIEQGLRVGCVRESEAAKRWLLSNFAYELNTQIGPDVLGQGSKVDRWLVDGYGTTSLTRYGGSGRAVVFNGMQVKGIGRTVFAARDADWHHGHGFIWLEEALREAVFSEVCRREAPRGAVPVVAVIALDETIAAPNDERWQRALLVRPFHARPAHLQRALLLERPELDDPLTAHLQDVARVRWHIEQWHRRSGDLCGALHALAHYYGQQAAYAHCCGWFNGGFTSSNLTLNGQFIDFGAARFVTDSRAIAYETLGQRFGDELNTATAVLDSLAFYIRKYSTTDLAERDVHAHLLLSYKRELACRVSMLLGADPALAVDNCELDSLGIDLANARSEHEAVSAIALEEAAIARYAACLSDKSIIHMNTAMARWRGIRFRQGASREEVQSATARAVAQERGGIQAWADGLINELCAPDNR